MALDTYSNLKAAVKRIDGSNNINDLLDDAIELCEVEMFNHQDSPLRVRGIATSNTYSLSTRYLALPSNFLEARRVSIVSGSGNQDVRYATPEAMQVSSSSGRPKYFTITSQFEFDRVPDSSYTIEVSYFEKPSGLSSSNATNSVLGSNPNIYLYGVLWAVNQFNAEEDKAEYYYNQFLRALRGANKSDKRARYGPAPTMKFEGMTP